MRKQALSPTGSVAGNLVDLNRKREFSITSDSGSSLSTNTSEKSPTQDAKRNSSEIKAESPIPNVVLKKAEVKVLPTATPAVSSPAPIRKKATPGSKRSISFDPFVLLLNICQFPPETDRTGELRKLLAEVKVKQDGVIDVNNIYLPSQWLTPLHIACTHGFSDMAKILIEEASAAVNITDKEGWTPLHCAVAEGHIETLELLAKCQGNMSTPPEMRENDIIYALDGPIDLAPRTDDGELPEEIADEEKADMITQMLKGYFY